MVARSEGGWLQRLAWRSGGRLGLDTGTRVNFKCLGTDVLGDKLAGAGALWEQGGAHAHVRLPLLGAQPIGWLSRGRRHRTARACELLGVGADTKQRMRQGMRRCSV